MATTSPDNLWSPDSGDDYALTIDWAASMETVQAAITSIRNSTRQGVFTGTTDTQGFITIPHGFSTSPVIAFSNGPVNGLPDANTRLYEPQLWDVSNSNFRVRYLNRGTNQWVNDAQAVVLSWVGRS